MPYGDKFVPYVGAQFARVGRLKCCLPPLKQQFGLSVEP